MNNREQTYKVIIVILSVIILILGFNLLFRKPQGPVTKAKPARATKKALPKKALRGKIAIVIDDLGYNDSSLEWVEGLRYPITFAVLPNLNYSKTLAEHLHRKGFEIILHLPMEPRENTGLETDTILTTMGPGQITKIMDEALASVPFAKGISNHMGSKMTEDPDSMLTVFNYLKRHRLFFLDSYVTADSVCPSLSSDTGILLLKRDIFLDNELDDEYIKEQIEKLKARASQAGFAIGIGHDRKATYRALDKYLPGIEEDGYKLVYLSQLLK